MDFQIRPNPLVEDAVDILMMVGEEHYTVQAFVEEAVSWGVSKKINPKSIPNGIVPNVSRIFVWHPRAIPVVTADGKTFKDLGMATLEGTLERPEVWEQHYSDLLSEWKPEELLLPADYVPPHIMKITYYLQALESKAYNQLDKEFGIQWQGGVIGYSYLGFIQYVCREGEDEVPEELAHIENIMPVKIEYIEEGEE